MIKNSGHKKHNILDKVKNLRKIIFLVLLVSVLNIQNSFPQIQIANKDTDNPTLLYKGTPMLKFGPLPETAIFAYDWSESSFTKNWLDWMQKNSLSYGRIYAESGYRLGGLEDNDFNAKDKSRVYPFKVVRWENDLPLVDITEFNPKYWENFEKVIRECAKRGIILQLQLYQRFYFQEPRKKIQDDGSEETMNHRWLVNYFNPENNVNHFEIPEGNGGYGIFQAMTKNTIWKEIHHKWVRQILDAIGHNGNVIIDLMNEGSFTGSQLSVDWVEQTLDIIESWEKENDTDILTGFDFDHLIKKNDPNLDYILGNPRLEVIIGEGSEGHIVPELVAGNRSPKDRSLALEFRQKYNKPVISTNSPVFSITENIQKVHLYQWYGMMIKVQGIGVYAKEFPLDFNSPESLEYSARAKILNSFFSGIQDYSALDISSGIIEQSPCYYQLSLASGKEIIVYLHTGEMGKTVSEGEILKLSNIAFPEKSKIKIKIFHPGSGASVSKKSNLKDNSVEIVLPEFTNDIVVHLTAKPKK